ncbi:hypothetical protein H4R34_004564 [Dimargaris verticillata]|uniref:Uncharacterized protein n=1 Tax=Dimargaris verticillata TaxID=2761393 RepID=A0A9W8B4N0_9FUNG|nr:hypothetical protein H4R34_004564 [Dimargaris verticillata]
MAHFFRAAYTLYASYATSHPILTLSLTNATLCAGSDILAQVFSRKAAVEHQKIVATSETSPLLRSGQANSPISSVSSSSSLATLENGGELQGSDIKAVHSNLPSPSLSDASLESLPLPITTGKADIVMAATSAGAKASIDFLRVAQFASYGFCLAPVMHSWYGFLNTHFPIPTVGAAVGQSPMNRQVFFAVCKRVLTDQICWAPIGLGIFFTFITLAEGGRFQEIRDKFEHSYFPALLTNYKVWPFVQFANFCYIPLLYQVPFVSLVSIFWNSYLSWLNSLRSGTKTDESNPLGA